MPGSITLKPHLTAAESYQRYRKCQQAPEKIRWRALYLIAKGGVANDVAKRVGRSSGWITKLARRYNRLGVVGVSDQRTKPMPSPPPTLSAKQAQALAAAFRGPAPGGGFVDLAESRRPDQPEDWQTSSGDDRLACHAGGGLHLAGAAPASSEGG